MCQELCVGEAVLNEAVFLERRSKESYNIWKQTGIKTRALFDKVRDRVVFFGEIIGWSKR